MTVSIDGPVGVVRPNSWWRTTKVTNYSKDQSKLVELFRAIPTSQADRVPGGDPGTSR